MPNLDVIIKTGTYRVNRVPVEERLCEICNSVEDEFHVLMKSPLMYIGMFKHCYVPQSTINLVIVPLVKNTSSDLTNTNIYRPITLSSIASKVFEHAIILGLEEYLWTNDNQLGFKSGYSTDLCIYALSELIKYFQSRSTSVYVAFIDASKAFNTINH